MTVTPTPGDPGQRRPDYSGLSNVFTFPDTRLETLGRGKWPYLAVHTLNELRTYQQNADHCRAQRLTGQPQDAGRCPKYQWLLPYSPLSASQEVAQELRRAWQRFEDRYYWHTMVALNAPAMWATNCVLDLGTGLKTTVPAVRPHVPPGSFPSQLGGRLTASQPSPDLHLDSYFPWPQVGNEDYCDGVQLDAAPMYLPGECFYAGTMKLFCLQGSTETLDPAAPRPLMFDLSRARERVLGAVRHAHTTYLPQYQSDVLAALFDPERPFFPLPWASNLPGGGAVLTPVMSGDVRLDQYRRLAQMARARLGGALGQNASPYYFQWAQRSPSLDVHLLPGRNEALGSPPGLWPLEEFKRTLAPASPALYELFGYSSFFEAWNEQRALALPEEDEAKVLRPVIYNAAGNNVYLGVFGSVVVPVPALVPIRPYYPAGLPFIGPQMQFDWVSVPEGYSIPRVRGRPLFDYAPLLK